MPPTLVFDAVISILPAVVQYDISEIEDTAVKQPAIPPTIPQAAVIDNFP